MRAWSLSMSVVAVVVLAGCGSSDGDKASVTISPAGPLEVTGPTTFSATLAHAGGPVSWALAGPGSLSAATGPSVVYTPPASPGFGKVATLTATIPAGASGSARLDIAPPTLPASTIPGLTAPVEILSDAWDVPHVTCAAAVDCFAAQGWLQARDRLFQMDFLRRVATGRLAELIGPFGLEQDVQLRTLFTTRSGQRLQDALLSAVDPVSRARLDAYVSGINARLAELRGAAAGELAGEYALLPIPLTADDVPDWTAEDVMAFVRLQQFSLSESIGEETDSGTFAAVYGPGGPLQDLGRLDAWIRAAAVAGERTHTLTADAPTPLPRLAAAPGAVPLPRALAPWAAGLQAMRQRLGALREVLHPLDGSFGSNNWVVDAAHSASGHAMVANDPHLSLRYPSNFYLLTLTSTDPADGLDVTGGGFPGTPGAQVGRGKHVGWGVTVVGYDVTDLYLEQALPCPAGVPAGTVFCVSFQGGAAPALAIPQTYLARTGPGAAGLVDAQTLPPSLRPPPVVVLVPHHGPIVQAPDAGGRAVSVRWTGHEDWTQDLRAFLGLNTAADVASAMAALEDYATGAQNFVLADDAGAIGYKPHALVPVRRFADVTVVGPAGLIPPWFPLPGDGSAEWGTGDPNDHCDGAGGTVPAAACWIAAAALPQGTAPAKGYFATANADPIGVSDDNNPLAHPPYLSFDWSDSTGFRHARITERLDALLAGGGKASRADMESIQQDHVSRMGAAFGRIIDQLPAGSADLEAARALLSDWKADGYDCPTGLVGTDPVASAADPDPTRSTDSAACLLFHTVVRTLARNVFADDLAVAGLGVSGGQAVKGLLYMLGEAGADQGFCDDVNGAGAVVAAHTCQEQLVTALESAVTSLGATAGPQADWRWGRVHTVSFVSEYPALAAPFRAGPFARPGGAFTVDVANPSLTSAGGSFAYGSGPNVRHVSVMDPAAPAVRMQLPGEERDVAFGTPTPGLLQDWVENRYFDYAHGDQVRSTAAAVQRLTP
jgi:penicillin amidase